MYILCIYIEPSRGFCSPPVEKRTLNLTLMKHLEEGTNHRKINELMGKNGQLEPLRMTNAIGKSH